MRKEGFHGQDSKNQYGRTGRPEDYGHSGGRICRSRRQGNDIVHGGDGDDQISGGSGNDVLSGGSATDFIFGGSGNWLTNGALSAVEMWAAEDEFYDYASNSCESGEVCGHYTQIVWRSSENLGCGIKLCNAGSPFGGGSWTFVVCNYDPPGNWVGQKPY